MRRKGPQVMNMTYCPGFARGTSAPVGPGQFQPPFAPSYIGWLCNCDCATSTCDSTMALPPEPVEGVVDCSPYYFKQP
jgi:hypothetical protein